MFGKTKWNILDPWSMIKFFWSGFLNDWDATFPFIYVDGLKLLHECTYMFPPCTGSSNFWQCMFQLPNRLSWWETIRNVFSNDNEYISPPSPDSSPLVSFFSQPRKINQRFKYCIIKIGSMLFKTIKIAARTERTCIALPASCCNSWAGEMIGRRTSLGN